MTRAYHLSTLLVPRLCLKFQQSLRNLKDVYPLSHYDWTCHLLHGKILSVHPNASAFEVCVWPAGAACFHHPQQMSCLWKSTSPKQLACCCIPSLFQHLMDTLWPKKETHSLKCLVNVLCKLSSENIKSCTNRCTFTELEKTLMSSSRQLWTDLAFSSGVMSLPLTLHMQVSLQLGCSCNVDASYSSSCSNGHYTTFRDTCVIVCACFSKTCAQHAYTSIYILF